MRYFPSSFVTYFFGFLIWICIMISLNFPIFSSGKVSSHFYCLTKCIAYLFMLWGTMIWLIAWKYKFWRIFNPLKKKIEWNPDQNIYVLYLKTHILLLLICISDSKKRNKFESATMFSIRKVLLYRNSKIISPEKKYWTNLYISSSA